MNAEVSASSTPPFAKNRLHESVSRALPRAVVAALPNKNNGQKHRQEPLTVTVLEPRRYRLFEVGDLATESAAQYRVKNVLPREGLAVIYGQSASGKTFLGMDLAFAIVEGREWFGHRVAPCDVLYIALEGRAGLSQRVKAYLERHDGAATERKLRFATESFSLLYSDDVQALVVTATEAGIVGGVIIIDTLNAATPGGDENTSVDMGLAIAAAKLISAECGGLVVMLHHPGKDSSKGLRGHSSLPAALDSIIEVTRNADVRSWKVIKSKDGPDGEERPFRLEVVELGADSDGDQLTSCVIAAEASSGVHTPRVAMPSGENQKRAYEVIGALLRGSTHFGQGGAPTTRPCVELEEAVAKVGDGLTTEPKRRPERARSAILGLINRGCLKLDAGWIWCS